MLLWPISLRLRPDDRLIVWPIVWHLRLWLLWLPTWWLLLWPIGRRLWPIGWWIVRAIVRQLRSWFLYPARRLLLRAISRRQWPDDR